MARYGQAFKDGVVARLLPPESAALELVAKEVGIGAGTLQRWREDVQSKPARGRVWTGRARLEAVITSAALNEAQTSAWCRQHMPYKGSGPLINDLVGGQVQAAFQTPADATQFINSGRLRALAVSGNARQAAFPDVPTLTEAGISNFTVTNWFGLMAPSGLPPEIGAKVADALQTVNRDPEFLQKLASLGLQPSSLSAQQFLDLMKVDASRMAQLIQDAKIKIE